ncbi:MAG TPA: PD-(D/E)XK nuclease family protein [Actinobacteria bacterium]|nr:PD-(D/E)XK nuclease family protein [Actinomycetota bacterium]
MRATIADPAWTRTLAESLGVTGPYDEAVDEFQTMLFSLPEPEAPADGPDSITRTSVTGLVTYATCPKRFFWSEVDRLPRRPSKAARRGTELHRKIEIHNRGNIPLDDVDDVAYDVPADSPEETETPAARGANSFEVFKTSRFGTILPVHVEMPFDLRVREDVWVRGRIDAIYPHLEDGWEVVDFKSGRNRNDSAAAVQLQAYALAVTAPGFSSTPPDPLRVTFAYFGEGLDEVSEDVNEAWLEAAQHRLSELFDGIRREQWTPTPSPACHHCDFQRFCEPGKEWVASDGS